MTGLDEFTKLFGNITVLNVLELALAVAFVIFPVTKRARSTFWPKTPKMKRKTGS